jgi:hypothetical protein
LFQPTGRRARSDALWHSGKETPNNEFMKTRSLFLLPAPFAVLNFLSAGRGTAQAFGVLRGFDGTDEANPLAGLMTNSSGKTLSGITGGGLQPFLGSSTVFGVNTDGAGFTNLHSFSHKLLAKRSRHPGLRLAPCGHDECERKAILPHPLDVNGKAAPQEPNSVHFSYTIWLPRVCLNTFPLRPSPSWR